MQEWMRQYGINTVVPEIRVSLPKSKSTAQQAGGAALQESTDRQAPAAKVFQRKYRDLLCIHVSCQMSMSPLGQK